MKKEIFKGMITNLITPFDDSGSVDYISLGKIIDFQIQSDVDGILLFGYMGEGYTLTQQEKYSVLQFVLDKITKKIHVYICMRDLNTGDLILKAKKYEDYSISGFILNSPHMPIVDKYGIIKHVEEISKNVSLPVLFNTMPYEHIDEENLDTDTTNSIYQLSKISGVMLSRSHSIIKISLHKKESSSIIIGSDFKLPAYFQFSFDGILSSSANVMPKQMKRLFELFKSGEISKAMTFFKKYQRLIEKLSYDTNPMVIKFILSKLDFCEDICRLPLTQLNEEVRQELLEILEATFNININSKKDTQDDYKQV